MLRPEEMEYVSFYFSKNLLRETMISVGNKNAVQFSNLNENLKPDNLHFSSRLKCIEKSEQRLEYFKNDIEIQDSKFDPSQYDQVADEINRYYTRLVELRHAYAGHVKMEVTQEENYLMADHLKKFIKSVSSDSEIPPLLVAITDQDKKFLIKKMIKHRLKRNVYIVLEDVHLFSVDKQRSIMIVYAMGNNALETAAKIVEAMDGRVYDAHKLIKAPGQLEKLASDYKRVSKIKNNSKKHIDNFLKIAGEKYLQWKTAVTQEKRICESMNKLRPDGDCYVGEGWVLSSKLADLEDLKSFDSSKGRFIYEIMKTSQVPPTHFSNSQFTEAFQNLTNVFGVPKYEEINPAVFLIFTFPFMFGAMFGDILHGMILMIMSFYMIFRFKTLNHQVGVLQVILNGRYVMLACSISAIWFGCLYGDFGSLPVSFFDSQYTVGRTYPFGIDPVWHHADNRLTFTNSLKMKLSLILGFFHMGLGSFISIINAIHTKDKIALVCLAIPQFVAFTLFLGYLVFLCIYKWLVTVNYPSLVNTLIGMYTDPFHIKQPMYTGQMYVQLFIYSTIIFCIFWMFFSKPVHMILKKKVQKDGMLDLWITSGIHMIEFGLGLISNTSSYLRLWAVSLAHVQLTSVLHQFTIGNSNYLVKILLFPVYVCGTIMLLIGLEGLSSCLHALRLNWIEFFSKFYAGGGEKHEPLNFDIEYEEIHE